MSDPIRSAFEAEYIEICKRNGITPRLMRVHNGVFKGQYVATEVEIAHDVWQAAKADGGEAVYQVPFSHEGTWLDATKDMYESCHPNDRRILYTSSPTVEEMKRKCVERCDVEHDGYDEPKNGWDMKNPLEAEYAGYQRACKEIGKAIEAIPTE